MNRRTTDGLTLLAILAFVAVNLWLHPLLTLSAIATAALIIYSIRRSHR